MANKYTDLVFEIRDLTSMQKIVLWCLAHRMNEKSETCWPGYGTIAKDACIGRSTAIRTIQQLSELGLLEKISGLRTSNTYRVNYDALLARTSGWNSLTSTSETETETEQRLFVAEEL